ncbi:unnamed protein product [Caenorhabditis nigoni]
MKAVYSIVFIFLFAITVSTGVSGKRGLSTDEQQKLLDVLNADRQALGENMGYKFNKLTYNLKLQRELDTEFHCENFDRIVLKEAPLQGDSATEGFMDEVRRDTGIDVYSRVYFNPKDTEIGCIKKQGCGTWYRDHGRKKVKFVGVCMFGPGRTDYSYDSQNTPEQAGMPNLSKYGELLGLGPASSEYAKTKPEDHRKHREGSDISGDSKKPNPYAEWAAEEATVDSKGSPSGSTGRFFSLTLFLGSILSFYF